MQQNFLSYEQPIAELEAKIDELRYMSSDSEATVLCAGIKNTTTAGLDITTNGGTGEKIQITNSQGDDNDAINLTATAGGITISTGGKLFINNLPTNSTGLSTGQIYNDSGTLKIA